MYWLYRFMYGLVGFSRSQTNGFLIFLPLVGLIIAVPAVVRSYYQSTAGVPDFDVHRLDSIAALFSVPPALDSARQINSASQSPGPKNFDPNTAPAEELVLAGFDQTIATRIVRYRERGGRFRENTDLLKIWGMDSALFFSLQPFIRIRVKEADIQRQTKVGTRVADQGQQPVQTMQDINVADTAALKKVFGIGEKLSLRILRYRESLGGFVSMEQLREVYNLDSALVSRIGLAFSVVPEFVPRRINLNTAGRQELATHPYIRDRAASAIVAYRFQHGSFKTFEELRKIPALDTMMLRKAVPYLKLSE